MLKIGQSIPSLSQYLTQINDLHRTEPYVYSQMIAGNDAWKPGEAKNSWLTGTAAWNFFAVAQYILGIQPGYDGLIIDPCIPKEWNTFKVTRKNRGTEYRIEVLNPSSVSKGVAQLVGNGKKLDGNTVPLQKEGTCKVQVKIG